MSVYRGYKKVMKVITVIENAVLAVSMLLVLVLTFGNVVGRKVLNHSWGFTEEIVVSVFVLISLLAAGVAARDDGLVNLSLVTDHVSLRVQKVLRVISTAICVIYSLILTWTGIGRMQVDHTLTPILHIPKAWFWGFVVVGGISLCLHFIENGLDFCVGDAAEEA